MQIGRRGTVWLPRLHLPATSAAQPHRVPAAEGTRTVAVFVNLCKRPRQSEEDRTFDQILDAPPSALAGLTPAHDDRLDGRPARM